MQFTTIILSLAALAIAAPTVEVARVARGGGEGSNGFAAACNQKGGSAFCCNHVDEPTSQSSTIPIDLTVLVQCVSLILSSPICGTATVCCSAPPQEAPAFISLLDGAQVCPGVAL